MIVAIEGVSYSGKSTLIRQLKKHYSHKKINVICSNENSTNVENGIRHLIKHNAFELTVEEEFFLFATRLKNKTILLNKKQRKNTLILIDRFDISFLVLFHFVRRMSLEKVENTKNLAISKVKPDAYIFLDTSEEKLKERFIKTKNSHVQREGLKHFKASRNGFKTLYKKVDAKKILLNTAILSKKECFIEAVNFIEKIIE
ncbi:MAG: deoxynucleoside kinase [Bacteroidia bacterium]|nr:deoxynucleoside kinase [Bacteroidia bacterium]